MTADAVQNPHISRVVAPVVGQQRNSAGVLGSQYSGVAAPQTALLNLSPGLSMAANTYDAAVHAGASPGASTAIMIPGSQPMIAVGAVASNVPMLMSQLASLQTSLVASAVYGSVPLSLNGSLYSVPNTQFQSDDSAIHRAFSSQTPDHDHTHNA